MRSPARQHFSAKGVVSVEGTCQVIYRNPSRLPGHKAVSIVLPMCAIDATFFDRQVVLINHVLVDGKAVVAACSGSFC